MKELMNSTGNSARGVVNSVLRGGNIEVIRSVGSFDLLYRILRWHRAERINPPPFLFPQLRLSEKLKLTHLRTPLYRYGLDNFGTLEHSNDILLFYSDFLSLKLQENDVGALMELLM
jgi:hypothetical protein